MPVRPIRTRGARSTKRSPRFTKSDTLAGVGFVFSADDPFCGIDLDDCLDADGNMLWGQDIIAIDAFYRAMRANMDENDNGTIASVNNHLDAYANRLGRCFVLVHRSSKGNQSGKAATEGGAGAASQSRPTDTHLILRAHEKDDCVVLDAAVRSWPGRMKQPKVDESRKGGVT